MRVAARVGELPHDVNAEAADVAFRDVDVEFRARARERIELRPVVADRQDDFRGRQGAVQRQVRIASAHLHGAHDVREQLLRDQLGVADAARGDDAAGSEDGVQPSLRLLHAGGRDRPAR